MPPRVTASRLASSLLSISQKTYDRPVAASPIVTARCASILSSLADNKGAYNKRVRLGRGPASGKGKTSGRGQKGQHAHGKVPAGFEGGQTLQSITNPERGRGKYNPFKVEMSPINLDRIQSWIDQGRLDPKKAITMKELAKSRCLHGVKRHGVKLLARHAEQLTSRINIIVSRASAEAIARVEALGGSVTTRFYSPTAIKRVLRGDSHPTISLQASPTLISLAAKSSSIVPSPILSSLQNSTGESHKEAMVSLMERIGQKYRYRLPDATGRKDIEYYRDPAHRGYLNYLVKEKESPSLFFKPPVEAKSGRKPSAKGKVPRINTAKASAAKAHAENQLF